MKKGIFAIIAAILCIGFAACSSEEAPVITTDEQGTTIAIPFDGKTTTYKFSINESWTIENVDSALSVSPMHGNSGNVSLTIKARETNVTNEMVTHNFTIVSKNGKGEAKRTIKCNQDPVFTLEKTRYEVDGKGASIKVVFTTPLSAEQLEKFSVRMDNNFSEMWDRGEEDEAKHAASLARMATTRAGDSKWEATFKIKENPEKEARTGIFFLMAGVLEDEFYSDFISVTQLPKEIEESEDYKNDGKVFNLLTHTKGEAGIPIVIMGDGFLDKDIEDGTYKKAMQTACDNVFSYEPMKSLKPLFDVYYVTAVSQNNIFSEKTKTAFSCEFGEGTKISGSNEKVEKYAKKPFTEQLAVDKDYMDNSLVIVVLNDKRWAGTCYYSVYPKKGIVQNSSAIAYCPMTDESKHNGYGFAHLLQHEAVGHGFGKLADEYAYKENGEIPEDEKKELEEFQEYGVYQNVSTSNDITKTYWAEFASDPRYNNEKLDVHLGGFTYIKGVYRPTEKSIMSDDMDAFNCYSRSMIYKRAMYITQGSAWQFNYEEFVNFDAPGRDEFEAKKATTRAAGDVIRMPLPKPVITIIQK